jgi:hypothetical protein
VITALTLLLAASVGGLVLDAPLTDGYSVGTLAYDRTPNRTHLTLVGSPTVSADGVDLNGTNQYVLESVSDYRGSDQAGTVCAWFNNDDYTKSPVIFGISDEATLTNFFTMGIDSSKRLYLTVRMGGTPNRIETTATVDDGVWYYLCASSNGSRYLMYINGQSTAFSVGSGTDNGDWVADIAAVTDNVTVGALRRTSVVSYAEGTIFGVRLYSGEATSTEVFDQYSRGRKVAALKIASSYQGLVLDVPAVSGFSDGSATLYDRDTSRYHMTAIGSPTIGTASITLDGSTQYLERSVSGFRGSDSSGTIVIWYKPSDVTQTDVLVSSSDTASINYYLFFGLLGSTGFPYVNQKDNDTPDQVNATACGGEVPANGVWSMFAIVSDGSSYAINLNDQPCSISVASGTNSGDWWADTANRDNLIIGALKRTSASGFTYGELAIVKIYDRALSNAELSDIHKAGPRLLTVDVDPAGSDLIISP